MLSKATVTRFLWFFSIFIPSILFTLIRDEIIILQPFNIVILLKEFFRVLYHQLTSRDVHPLPRKGMLYQTNDESFSAVGAIVFVSNRFLIYFFFSSGFFPSQ